MNGRATAAPALLSVLLVATACSREPGGPRPAPETTQSPPSSAARRSESFGARYVDITHSSGIRFRHETGGYGEKLLPETMGSGAALMDYDQDGHLDIFFVNSTRWRAADGPPASCALYRGRGDGTFEDVTQATGAGVSVYGMGCAAGDYDGDGDEDIYITAVGDNVLLANDEGGFRDVTAAAGVAGGRWQDREGRVHPEWSTAAAWADIDRDGDLDLFVANYVQWSIEHEIFTTLDGISKAFTTPDRYSGLPPRLFRNHGDGTFTDVSEPAGLRKEAGKSLGIASWDFDSDGSIDFAVANDTRPNFLFLNQGGGRFAERALDLGIAYDENGRARAGMGIDIADYAGDGVPGVAIGNFSSEPMSLYRWRDGGGFATVASRAGLSQATYAPLAFGVLFLDADLDGVEDLVVANGHIEPDIARTSRSERHAQRPQLFRGGGDGTFEDVSDGAGPAFAQPLVGRGLAAGDIDGDGDLDLLVTTNGGAPALLRNDLAGRPHFLRVRLRGAPLNTSALGARIRLSAGGTTRTRLVRTGSSYLSQSESTVTFGLGASTTVERLEVRWPLGAERVYAVHAIDTTLEIDEQER